MFALFCLLLLPLFFQRSTMTSAKHLAYRRGALGYQSPNPTNQDSIKTWLKHEEPNSTNRRTRQRQEVINQIPSSSLSAYSKAASLFHRTAFNIKTK